MNSQNIILSTGQPPSAVEETHSVVNNRREREISRLDEKIDRAVRIKASKEFTVYRSFESNSNESEQCNIIKEGRRLYPDLEDIERGTSNKRDKRKILNNGLVTSCKEFVVCNQSADDKTILDFDCKIQGRFSDHTEKTANRKNHRSTNGESVTSNSSRESSSEQFLEHLILFGNNDTRLDKPLPPTFKTKSNLERCIEEKSTHNTKSDRGARKTFSRTGSRRNKNETDSSSCARSDGIERRRKEAPTDEKNDEETNHTNLSPRTTPELIRSLSKVRKLDDLVKLKVEINKQNKHEQYINEESARAETNENFDETSDSLSSNSDCMNKVKRSTIASPITLKSLQECRKLELEAEQSTVNSSLDLMENRNIVTRSPRTAKTSNNEIISDHSSQSSHNTDGSRAEKVASVTECSSPIITKANERSSTLSTVLSSLAPLRHLQNLNSTSRRSDEESIPSLTTNEVENGRATNKSREDKVPNDLSDDSKNDQNNLYNDVENAAILPDESCSHYDETNNRIVINITREAELSDPYVNFRENPRNDSSRILDDFLDIEILARISDEVDNIGDLKLNEVGLSVAVPVTKEHLVLGEATKMHTDTRTKQLGKRKHYLMFAVIVLLLCVGVVGVIVGFATKKSISREDIGIQEYVAKNLNIDLAEILYHKNEQAISYFNSPYSMALRWIILFDPLELTPEKSPNFLQRYILACFYFATTMEIPENAFHRSDEVNPINTYSEWTMCGPSKDMIYKNDNRNNATCLSHDHINVQLEDNVHFTYNPNSKFWLSSTNECDWLGITCDHAGHVVEITQANNKLSGIYPYAVKYLPFLRRITIREGALQGTLPNENFEKDYRHLAQLEAQGNRLSGALPEEFIFSRNLISVRIFTNNLEGTIPNNIGEWKDLRYMLIGNNNFSGNMTSTIGNLRDLRSLKVNDNNFNGSLPSELGFLNELIELSIANNTFTGEIPTQIGNLKFIEHLELGFNELVGQIPSELYSLTNLTKIYIENNKFTGTISTRIGNFEELRWLNVLGNRFTGALPTELGMLHELKQLTVSQNSFSGSLPSEVCELRLVNKAFPLAVVEADCLIDSTGMFEISCPEGCCTLCCDPAALTCLEPDL